MKRLILILLFLFAAITAQATTITVSSTAVQNFNYVSGATSATLRIWATESFVDSSGTFILGGNVGQSSSVYKTVACVVSSGTLTIPSFTIASTTDSIDLPQVTYVAYLYDQNGTRRDLWMPDFELPASNATTTWAQIRLYNANIPAPRPNEFYSKDQINVLLAASYPCLTSSDATKGCLKTSVTPSDAANPVAVGDNDPRVPTATGDRVCYANQQSGATMAAKITACDTALSTSKGVIIAQGGGTISADVIVNSNHTLHLGAGTWQLAIGTEHNSHFRYKDDVTIDGEGNATIIKQSSGNHDGQYQEFVAIQGDAAYNNAGSVVRNFTLRNLQIQVNRADFDSVRAAVLLGNCHHCLVENVTFDRWGTIGLAIGGGPSGGTDPYSLGHFSDDVTVRNCTFLGVASQNLAAVNSKNFHFTHNRFIAPGQAAGPSLAVIDLETNTSNDLMEGFEVADNIIDARLSPVTVNGISYTSIATQNGPGLIAHNQIWGRTIGGAVGNLSNGIIATGTSRDVVIFGNTIIGAGQQGIAIGGLRFTVVGNTLTDTGGSASASLTATGVTNSTFFANRIYSPDAGYGDSVVESSGASGNSYSSNFVPNGTTLLGTSRVFNEDRGDGKLYNYSASANGTVVFQYRTQYNGSTSGTTTLQASAIAGTTNLTLPAVTDTLTANAAAQTLTNKTLTAPVINSPTGIVKGDVGLGNVDNTSDATKNAASVTLTNKTISAASNTLTGYKTPLLWSSGGSGVTKTATNYLTFGAGALNGTESNRQIPSPYAGTLKNLRIQTFGSQGNGTLVVTLRVNGVDTAVTFTISAAAGAGVYSDTTHSVSVSAGDLISIKIVNNSTDVDSSFLSMSAELDIS